MNYDTVYEVWIDGERIGLLDKTALEYVQDRYAEHCTYVVPMESDDELQQFVYGYQFIRAVEAHHGSILDVLKSSGLGAW